MALFEVPGWSVPDRPVVDNSKKRKRPSSSHSGLDHAVKLHSAEVSIEKLMNKLGKSQNAAAAEHPSMKKKKGKGKQAESHQHNAPGPSTENGSKTSAKLRDKTSKKPGNDTQMTSTSEDGHSSSQKKQKKQKKQSARRLDNATAADSEAAPSPGRTTDAHPEGNLTALQASMKSSLHGARFRWINETLYKSTSELAHGMMRKNPSVFSEYHTGFRHQVQSWPSNPVSHYVSTMSSKLPRTVIADLGCGDAALARALQAKGLIVLSYDLVSDNAYVIEADICTHIPLPGSEDSDEESGSSQVVDVVICALSLMGTNWPKCIREAWRILKPGGELKIAEVASRFTDVKGFTSVIGQIGFKLGSMDDSNTHFTLFEFSKVTRKPKNETEWNRIVARGDLLKPCEYKRR